MSQLVRTLPLEEYEKAAAEYCRSLPLEHFMEATLQADQREITLESLALLRARRPEVRVYNELLVQYLHEGQLRQVVPDNMVVLADEPPKSQTSYNLELEPAAPLWMLEYVSPRSQRKDYGESFRKYEHELRVPYCLLYSPDRRDLRFYRLVDDRYEQVPANKYGRLELPELELEIGILDEWVRYWHRGELLDLPAELQFKLEQERERTEQERKHAEKERQRAEQEKQQRLAAEAEVIRLQELVKRLKGERAANGPGPETHSN